MRLPAQGESPGSRPLVLGDAWSRWADYRNETKEAGEEGSVLPEVSGVGGDGVG